MNYDEIRQIAIWICFIVPIGMMLIAWIRHRQTKNSVPTSPVIPSGAPAVNPPPTPKSASIWEGLRDIYRHMKLRVLLAKRRLGAMRRKATAKALKKSPSLEKFAKTIKDNPSLSKLVGSLSKLWLGAILVVAFLVLLRGGMLWSIVVSIIMLIAPVSIMLWMYLLFRACAQRGIFFTDGVKQGRIHFVMVGGIAKKCLANLREQQKWVNPYTGDIWKVEFNAKGKISKGRRLDWKNREKVRLPKIKDESILELMNGKNPILEFLENEFGWYFMSWQPDAKLWEGMFSRYQAKGEREANDPAPKSANIELVYRQEKTNALFPTGIYGIDATAITGIDAIDSMGVPIPRPSAREVEILSENNEVLLKFAIEIEVTNALKAQFEQPSNPYFMAPLMKGVESGAKQVVAGMTYDTLTTSTVEGEKSRWFSVVKELNEDQLGGNPSLIQHGVMITGIHLISQRITDSAIAAAVAKRNTSKLTAEAVAREADGRLQAKLKDNLGEGDEIEKVEAPRQKLAIELMKARAKSDPLGVFADAEARGKWPVQYYAPGGGGPLPLINLDLQKKVGGKKGNEQPEEKVTV